MTAIRSLRASIFAGHPVRVALACMALAALTPSVVAQRQFDELRHGLFPADSDSTNAVALGDIDGDGDGDIVFGGVGQNRLYLNDRGLAYIDATGARMPADSDTTYSVALGDLDGDGDLDIVFGNGESSGQHNRLYLNDGSGIFTDATAGRMPFDSDITNAVGLSDVDGDGDLDMVLGNSAFVDAGQQNRLYLNNGSGIFTDATAGRIPAESDVTNAVALSDVDGDGDVDMIFGNGRGFSGQQNRLYLNDGTGTYTDVTAARMPADSNATNAVVLGDVDADGDLDMVLGNAGIRTAQQNRLYLNDGTGTYTDATAAYMPANSDATNAVALGDIDKDGDLDMIVGNAGNPSSHAQRNRLSENDGTGRFIDAPMSPTRAHGDFTFALVLGDVDIDGDLDMVLANHGQNRLYLKDKGRIFTDANEVRMPADSDVTRAAALGDVDDDGDLDMVFANALSQNRLYANDGTGTYTDATTGRLPGDSQFTLAVALGDVDGDDDLDIVFGNAGVSGQRQNRLYLNGGGAYADSTAARMPADDDVTNAVALGDVDGDGDLDLVVGNSSGFGLRQNRLYLNDGSGAYKDVTTARMPFDLDPTNAVALGDVDNDGDLDIVFGNGGVEDRLYLNDGTGVYGDASTSRMPVDNDTTVAAALGDVDGDGDLDLVFGSASSFGGRKRLYLNDGGGTYTDATATRMPADGRITQTLALGDVDGDGDLDLVFGTMAGCGHVPPCSGGQNQLYLNDGSGTYVDASAARVPGIREVTNAVALGDVDNDGDLDMVFGNTSDFGQRQNRIYLNLLRQLDTPWRPGLSRAFAMDFYAKPGYGTSFHTAIPALSLALAPVPLSLPPLGDLYLDPNGVINLPWVAIPPSTGKGTLEVTVPADPSLVGQTVYVQALIVNNAQPYGDSHLTGYTADLIIK